MCYLLLNAGWVRGRKILNTYKCMRNLQGYLDGEGREATTIMHQNCQYDKITWLVRKYLHVFGGWGTKLN